MNRNREIWDSSDIEKKVFLSRVIDEKRNVVFLCKEKLIEAGISEIDGIVTDAASTCSSFDKYQEVFGTDPIVDYFEKRYEKRNEIEALIKKSTTDGKSYVYFFINSKNKYCKIGYSKNPVLRLKEVQVGCPVELMIAGIIEGDKHSEKDIHDVFGRYRTHGEWFQLRGDLKKFIVDQFYC